jgi:hypothetical protein
MTTFALLLLMAVTRVQHFGDGFHLPDASWAVFFLLGWIGQRARMLALSLVVACALDLWVIEFGQVSSVCLTWGYAFLIPAYAVLWWAGLKLRGQSLAWLLLGLTAAVIVTFVISNLGIWWFAPQASELSLLQYSQRVLEYLPSYWAITLLYSLVGVVAINLMVDEEIDKQRQKIGC